MGILDSIHDAGAVTAHQPPAPRGTEPAADGDPPEATPLAQPRAAEDAPGDKNVYLTKASLTFPGVTTAGGILGSIISNAAGWETPKLWVSALIGLALGAFLLALGLTMASDAAKAERGFVLQSVGVAVVNTVMLVAAIQGITEVTT